MSEWFVYQPNGQHVGPMPGAALARGVLEGRIPTDAHVARAGATSWQVVTGVAEVSMAMASRVAPTVSPPPAIAPAPPPRATLPPAVQGLGGYGSPRAEVAPSHISSTMPSNNPRGGGVRPKEEVVSLTLPFVALGICLVVAMLETFVGLVFLRPEGAAHFDKSSMMFVLAACCTMVVPPRAAAYRFLGAVLLLTSALGYPAEWIPQLVNVLVSALIFRFMTHEREHAANTASVFGWTLVPGVTVVVWCAEAFLFR